MPLILPHNWRPRDYQIDLWRYLERGGKRAVACWHRRAGKDENCLHWAARAAHMRPATYWHMLPEAAQARKAIWDAINPHTGKRRIDEAFPDEIRETTRENEMFIKFLNGSTWQVVGSDNFNSLLGSPPAGVVFSEWSLADPAAWGYLRPILRENGGWALFIYTPRGRNHGHTILQEAKNNPEWFWQILSADETRVFSNHDLQEELKGYIAEYGQDQGTALFEQEYYCSFIAATLGSVYGSWIERMEKVGRITSIPIDRQLPVHTAWDIGFNDATAIWFFQVSARKELRLVDYYEINGRDPQHFANILISKAADPKRPFRYGTHFLPHDATHKTLAAGGQSLVQQLHKLGIKARAVHSTSIQNSITAARKMLDHCYADEANCAKGLEAARSYHYKWDEEKKCFSDKPVHDWSSHGCNALEIVARVWQTPPEIEEEKDPQFLHNTPFDDIFWKGIRHG